MKCQHLPCQCMEDSFEAGQSGYCSQSCAETAQSAESPDANASAECPCGHPACTSPIA